MKRQSPMPQGGHSRASFDLGKPGQYTFLMTISGDGQNWQPAMEGRYRNGSKAGKAAKAMKMSKARKLTKAPKGRKPKAAARGKRR